MGWFQVLTFGSAVGQHVSTQSPPRYRGMNLLTTLALWRLFRGDGTSVQKRIWARWEKSRAIYCEAVGYGARTPIENRLVHLTIERFPGEALAFFNAGLAHPNPKVVGYSLLGLAALDRSLLDKIAIPQPERTVTWHFGCCGTECSLDRLKAIVSGTAEAKPMLRS